MMKAEIAELKKKKHKNRWVSKSSPIKICIGSKQRKGIFQIIEKKQ